MIHLSHPSIEGGLQNFHLPNMYEPLSFPSTTASTSQYYYPRQHQLSSHEGLQYPSMYPYLQVNQSLAYPAVLPFKDRNNAALSNVPNRQPQVLSMNEEKRLVDAWMTKVARSRRIMARQKSLSLSRNSSAGSSTLNFQDANGLRVSSAGSNMQKRNDHNAKINQNLYTFCTPDKKRLRVLLKKELKYSDIGSLGRIVLPKREAEENLPVLFDKEGIQVMVRDVYSNQEWGLKYKYWSNNKSRMYVLENTGDFAKENGLEIGDCITLYDDECKNLYVSIKRKESPVAEPSYREQSMKNNNNMNNIQNIMNDVITELPTCDDIYDSSHSYELAEDEEEASLALLIEQLKHKELQGANSLLTLSTMDPYLVGGSTKIIQPTMAIMEPSSSSATSSSSLSITKIMDQDFYNYYTDLGTLPEVSNTYSCNHIINDTTL
ncbi:hypothetical protein FEM48_Zijuj01G0157100 [Ziziphus jujuba var. spinosa]|uniref:TF-B3 domain-containing protein n=1 Tax=Ziziphus jujuba var. spinosa TaxID=714518 RepID=A0A978W242_ZIZJJ|nr:hypothetical protein FEM48_Zijuj01G0157100 [Ziziphus jujuba var. spinosa]